MLTQLLRLSQLVPRYLDLSPNGDALTLLSEYVFRVLYTNFRTMTPRLGPGLGWTGTGLGLGLGLGLGIHKGQRWCNNITIITTDCRGWASGRVPVCFSNNANQAEPRWPGG